MEKFLFYRVFAGNKLNVVYKQRVGAPVFFAQLIGVGIANVLDNIIGEIFTGDINNLRFRVFAAHIIFNGF